MISTTTESPKTARSTPPRRLCNDVVRVREHLTIQEVETLRKAARATGRHTHRDDTMILLMFRHALRVSEVIALRWTQVDLKQGLLHVRRIKNGVASTHPLRGVELRALRKLQGDTPQSPYVFVSELKAPLSARSVHHIVARAGKLANFEFSIHPHMLRHSTGFYLANQGHDTRAIQCYLGHANIKNTVRYTQLAANRFDAFWGD